MRIISGTLKGQIFETPSGHKTHPMSEKIRGALFNILGDIDGLKILDAFGGSGGISLEAISRGAGSVTIVENDRIAQKTIENNISKLNLGDRVTLVSANVSSWMNKNPNEKFDLVIADPPYDKLQYDLIEKLYTLLSDEGLLVLSWPGNDDQIRMNHLKLVDRKNYGDAQLIFYSLIK
ncbi:MAG: RsmD family RNA methyltransferase [bacterium]